MSFKKTASLACIAALLALVLSACGSTTDDLSNSEIVGQVQSIKNSTITLLIGTLDSSAPTQPAADGSNDTSSERAAIESTDVTAEQPPAMPTGTATDNSASYGETPPAKPDGSGAAPTGDMPAGSPPSGGTASNGAPGGGRTFTAGTQTVTITINDDTEIKIENAGQESSGSSDDISEGDILDVTIGESNAVTSIVVKDLSSGGGFGGSATVTNGTSANTISEDADLSGETYTSTGDDENALRVDGATVALSGITVNKSAGATSSTENGDFYGMNAGLLALNGAQVTIKNSEITTSAQNGNGVFSYGDGTTVNISDSKIRTSADNSGGIQTTGGGTTNASNLDVQTEGNSSAAIRSDRGGGTVNVSGGKYVTNGTGSPAIYSTADISVSGSELIANSSEAVVVEGKNSVALTDCDVSGSMSGTYNDSSENIHNIMIYQSMSGDADVGNASFSMTGGSLTSKAGDMFYITNTSCDITLSKVELTLANGNLMTVAGNTSSRGWGTQGKNGGNVVMKVIAQTMRGIINVDDISSLELSITEGSTFTGCINLDGQEGTVAVTLDKTSKWTLTGNCYLSSFSGDVSSIVANGYKVYVNGSAIN